MRYVRFDTDIDAFIESLLGVITDRRHKSGVVISIQSIPPKLDSFCKLLSAVLHYFICRPVFIWSVSGRSVLHAQVDEDAPSNTLGEPRPLPGIHEASGRPYAFSASWEIKLMWYLKEI